MPQETAQRTLTETVQVGSLSVSPDSIPVMPSDMVDDPNGPFRALRANTAGLISVVTAAGTLRQMNFLAGETRYVAIRRIRVSGTGATGIEGMP